METRICSHKYGCGKELSIENFKIVRNTNSKTGKIYTTRRTMCDNCKKRNDAEWRRLSKYEQTEKRKEYRKRYYQSKGGKQFARERSKRYREKYPEKVKAQYEKNKHKYRGYRIKSKYGITEEDYKNFLIEQDYKCAICGAERKEIDLKIVKVPKENSLHIDHDHSTGKVRGLLCWNCNTALGHFKDNINNLKSAIKYLEENS